MKRQRLQRVAMQWAATLATMSAADERPAVAAPQPDDSLGDLRFRALLSDDDWASLPAPVRRRFSKRLAEGCTVVYAGEVLDTYISALGWCLAQLARLIGGPLPTAREVKVPMIVTVTEDMASGGQIWTRLYGRRRGFPQIIHSAKRFAGPTGIEEYLGRGLSISLRIGVRDGVLVFESDSYFLALFGRRWRLPDWLSPGTMTVTHAERGNGRFTFSLEVDHPHFGLLVRQSAVFREFTP
jgi:Domain of unknown function (DUF4166)